MSYGHYANYDLQNESLTFVNSRERVICLGIQGRQSPREVQSKDTLRGQSTDAIVVGVYVTVLKGQTFERLFL